MGGNSIWQEIYYRLSRLSPLAWAFILIIVALLLVRIDSDFTKKLALLPTILALLLIYQAIFRGKMY